MEEPPPTPPEELDEGLCREFENYPPERLRAVARYAEKLADYREREAEQSEQAGEIEDERSIEDSPPDTPEGVPAKASLTIKEINDNRYYYWQWRDGDKVKSKYKGPVSQGE